MFWHGVPRVITNLDVVEAVSHCTVNTLFVAAASITIVCSRIDDGDGKVGAWL